MNGAGRSGQGSDDVRRELVIDADVASFTGAICGVFVAAAFAAIQWWYVFQLRAPRYQVRWHDYVVTVLAGWVLFRERERPLRFGAGLLLATELGRLATAWLRLSDSIRRVISLWPSLTMALLFSAVVIFGISWLCQKVRTAKLVDTTGPERN